MILSRLGLMCVCGGLALAACTKALPPDDHAAPAMTGTVAQRNAAIRAALESDDRVAQLNMQHLSLEIALQFLAKRLNVDMRVDWDALQRAGIERDTAATTLNLFGVTYADGLRAVLWQLRPKSGSIGSGVADGTLLVAPQPAESRTAETGAQKAADAAIAGKLREPFDPAETRGTGEAADTLFYFLSFSKKISLVVDWDELGKIGVKRDAGITITLDNPTTKEYLEAVIAGLKPTGGDIGYDIRNGMLRVSTRARLHAEQPRQP